MYSNLHLKRSWVEINLNQLVNNYRLYKKALSNKNEIMVVVKADAYGHGDIEVAKVLETEGVQLFAVSNIEEAIGLRDAGIKGEILILGYTPVECVKQLLEYDITQALLDENYAERIAETEVRIKAQFAIDTGMNRIGLDADKPEYCERVIRKYFKYFELSGVFTHLCVADTDTNESNKFTRQQIEKFKRITDSIVNLNMPYVHCMNSAGGLFHGGGEKIVRLGILLYGMKPDYNNSLPNGIKPILFWKSVVAMVKELEPGETVGYGRTFIANKRIKIATIPTGYADGYRRELSNKGKVEINGQIAEVVGRVCMDQFMVDVTEIDVKCGDEVILVGEHYTADDMARDIGTIGYEVVCGISKRVSRIYK